MVRQFFNSTLLIKWWILFNPELRRRGYTKQQQLLNFLLKHNFTASLARLTAMTLTNAVLSRSSSSNVPHSNACSNHTQTTQEIFTSIVVQSIASIVHVSLQFSSKSQHSHALQSWWWKSNLAAISSKMCPGDAVTLVRPFADSGLATWSAGSGSPHTFRYV